MSTTKEQIYDSQISPLVREIIRICTENNIATIMDFGIGYDEDAGSVLKCTTAIMTLECEPTEDQVMAWSLLKPRPSEIRSSPMTSE